MIKKVKVEEAIGMARRHDLTKVIRAGLKGRLFNAVRLSPKTIFPSC